MGSLYVSYNNDLLIKETKSLEELKDNKEITRINYTLPEDAIIDIPPNVNYVMLKTNGSLKINNIPESLEELNLYCKGNIELPVIPENLKALMIWSGSLNKFPNFPNNIEHLILKGLNLKEFPDVCHLHKLITFNISDNPISILPKLSDSIRLLNIERTKITSIKSLPSSLNGLVCRYLTNLTSLPILPETISYVDIFGTEIKEVKTYSNFIDVDIKKEIVIEYLKQSYYNKPPIEVSSIDL